MRRDNDKFPNNSSLGMVSVSNGATLDLAVSNLTVTFPGLQNELRYTQAPKSLLLAPENLYNSRQTIGSSSLELSNLWSTLTFTISSIYLKFPSQASLDSPQNSSSQLTSIYVPPATEFSNWSIWVGLKKTNWVIKCWYIIQKVSLSRFRFMCIFHNSLKTVNKYIFITVPGYPQNLLYFINCALVSWIVVSN